MIPPGLRHHMYLKSTRRSKGAPRYEDSSPSRPRDRETPGRGSCLAWRHRDSRYGGRKTHSRKDCRGRQGQDPENGQVRTCDVKVGDKILFGKYSDTEVKVDGEELVVMREEDVMAVIESK
jgi:hypothetical protein